MLVCVFQRGSDLEELNKVFRDQLVHFSDRPVWLPLPRFPLSSYPGLSSLLLSRILFAPIWRFSPLVWFLGGFELPVRIQEISKVLQLTKHVRSNVISLSMREDSRKSLTFLVSCCCFNPAPYKAPVTAKPATREAIMSGRAFSGLDVIELAMFELQW